MTMTHSDCHLSDEVLVRLADGELAARESGEARAHLAACWDCRTRLGDLESTIGAFVHAHHDSLDPRLPTADGPRALLRARLREARPISPLRRWLAIAGFTATRTRWRYAFAALLLGVGVFIGSRYRQSPHGYSRAALKAGVSPNRVLTPGSVRSVEQKDVCTAGGADDNDPAWLIPAAVEQDVLRKYGIAGSRAKDYQLDYLIPPSLGGTPDIQNVWPEPYSNLGWNAHVKDELETRLRQLVCEGRVSLPEAQRDISGDWIKAYQKYFHTSRPVSAL
jgi:hypothetical protein